MRKPIFRAIALALIFTLMAATVSFAAVPADVKGQVYETAIQSLMEKGVITGYTDGTFKPDQSITRAEVCAIVVRAMNPVSLALTTAPETSFKDKGDFPVWATPYINYAVSKNIINGYPDGTFRASGEITYIETMAMALRAAGYTDSVVGGSWPTNYQQKATDLNLMTNLPTTGTNSNADRWMVAQFVYNSYSQIQTTAGNGFIPGTTALIRANGKFNSAVTEYDGKPIAKGVQVYTYGKASQFVAGMTLPGISTVYTEDTIYKFKDATTPACYAMKDGQIIGMILPMDTGFSGRVYAVINGTSQRLNGDGDAVTAFDTIAAGHVVEWLGRTVIDGIGNAVSTGPGAGYLDGIVYELITSNGQVKEINMVAEGHVDFDELTTPQGIVVSDHKVVDYTEPVVSLSNGDKFEIASNAAVYVRNSDMEGYTFGSLSDIRSDVYIRAYDITDEGSIASIIIVDKDHTILED